MWVRDPCQALQAAQSLLGILPLSLPLLHSLKINNIKKNKYVFQVVPFTPTLPASEPSRAPDALVIKAQSLIQPADHVLILPAFSPPPHSLCPVYTTFFPQEGVKLHDLESCVLCFSVPIFVLTHLSPWLFNNLITETRLSQLWGHTTWVQVPSLPLASEQP